MESRSFKLGQIVIKLKAFVEAWHCNSPLPSIFLSIRVTSTHFASVWFIEKACCTVDYIVYCVSVCSWSWLKRLTLKPTKSWLSWALVVALQHNTWLGLLERYSQRFKRTLKIPLQKGPRKGHFPGVRSSATKHRVKIALCHASNSNQWIRRTHFKLALKEI